MNREHSREGKTISRHRNWLFRINTKDTDFQRLKSVLDSNCKKYVFQYECPEGTENFHYQGCLAWKSAKSFSQTVAALQCYGDQSADFTHVEVIRDWAAQVDYCQKEDTRVAGPWILNCKRKVPPPKDPLANVQMYAWQRDVLTILEMPPDGRTVHWRWEQEGKRGKSALAKHLYLNGEAFDIHGAAKHVFYYLGTQIRDNGGCRKAVIFDIPRCQDKLFTSYQSFEGVLDGKFFATKYESNYCCFDPPHVFVFANFAPDQNKMSMDRWDIVEI